MKDDEKTRAQLIEELSEYKSKYRLLTERISDGVIQRKRSEEALRDTENQLFKALEMAHAGNWEYDVDRDLFTFNDSFYKIFRTTAAEVGSYQMSSADYARKFCHPEDIAVVGNAVREAIESTDPNYDFQIEHRILYSDGEVGYITVRFFIVLDSEGRTISTYGVNQDITKRKLLEKQLIEVQKMESVGRLAGGVAHDFNNLLTVILSCAETLAASMREDDPIMEDIRDIQKAGKRGATLTRQLLAFGRGQMIQPQIMDLNILITDLERMVHRLIGEDIDMRFTPNSELWKVEADPGQIEQIIMNIAINARDAMPHGGKLIIETANVELDEEYVRYRSMVTPGEYVMIAITDTGCGMDTETMKTVFEPFFTTKETGKGTGLGLSVAYGIVKQHKGNIWVYSEPGKGTTFKIYLPRSVKKTGPEYKSRVPVEIAKLGGSETVLVVDDDETILRAVVRMLKQYGYNTLQAASGAQAKVMSDEYQGPIHLLLTDVVMPGMSGRETAESVLVGRPEMGLIFMSGYTGNAIAHHGVLDPEVNFISKPFSNDDLARKVRLVIDENQEKRQSSSD